VNKNRSESRTIKERTLLLLQQAQRGDMAAQNTLVQENLGLVWSIIKRFKARDVEKEDLFQIGCIGLVKAIKKFDPGFEVCFSTYAVPMITGEIKRFLRDDGTIKVSRALKELGQKARALQEAIEKESGQSPSINEMADRLDVEPEELIQALESGYQPESLYKTIGDNEHNPIYLIDILHSEDNMKESVILERLALSKALQKLDERSRKLIFLRYFKEETQQMVALKLGISQVQVSRLEKKIMEELRNNF
jgi:RNA polymerase sporulation-specific sigma factor